MVCPGNPSTSPVCAKREMLRSRTAQTLIRKASNDTTSPVARLSVSVDRCCGCPPSPLSMANTTGARSEAGIRTLIVRQPGTCFSATSPECVETEPLDGSSLRGTRLRREPPPPPSRPSATTLLRQAASPHHGAIDERVRPRERDGHRREDDDEERHAGPDSDDVVPVEVASLAAKVAAEQHNGPNALPRPLAWEPQVETRADDEQEERRWTNR